MMGVEVWTIVWLLFQGSVISGSQLISDVEEKAQWSFHRKLYDYKAYGAINLQRIEIPEHTVALNITLNAYSSDPACKHRDVKIFANTYGLPVVSRNGESFPSNTYISTAPVLNMSMSTNNVTELWGLEHLQAGQLFLMAIMPRTDTRIKQQGLGQSCEYFISMRSSLHYIPKQKLITLPMDVKNEVTITPNNPKLLSFRVPADVVSFLVDVEGCSSPCDAQVYLWTALSPGMWDEPQEKCHWKNGSCKLHMAYPVVNADYYIGLDLSNKTSDKLSIIVLSSYCESSLVRYRPHRKLSPKKSCHLLYHLGRETPAGADEGSDMFDHFVCWDKGMGAHSSIDVNALDYTAAVMGFALRTSDVGSSLTVRLHLPDQKLPKRANVYLCITAHHLSSAMECKDGALLQLSSSSSEKNAEVLIPYPQRGQWYLALQSRCFTGNQSSSDPVKCPKYPQVNITIHLSPCVSGECGKYGSCKLYFESNIMYSSCSCYEGWRGYGCNDGSKATSDFTMKLGVYLLTLSNLGFVPGIIIAFYKRLYIEGVAYSFNMFFSTFYHACDSSHVYKLCIMPYGVLSFSDFMASLLSFWVTLHAMARVSHSVRSFCHMIGVLFIAVAVVYNKHGLFEQLVPIAVGVGIVILTWGREMYRSKKLFPSKRRYLFFILPGLGLAVLGLMCNLLLETEENYKYTHSMWHILVSASIIFLLPPRRDLKIQDECEFFHHVKSALSTQAACLMNQHEPSEAET